MRLQDNNEIINLFGNGLLTIGIEPVAGFKSFFKLFIDKSRIGLEYDGKVLRIASFLYNQFLDEREV